MVPMEHKRLIFYERNIDFGDYKIHFQDYITEEFEPVLCLERFISKNLTI